MGKLSMRILKKKNIARNSSWHVLVKMSQWSSGFLLQPTKRTLLWPRVYCSLNTSICFVPVISWLLKSKYLLDVSFEILDFIVFLGGLDFIVCRRTINYLCIPCMERSESYSQNCQWRNIYLLCYGFGILLPLEDIIQKFV